jgi:hypothetical protein
LRGRANDNSTVELTILSLDESGSLEVQDIAKSDVDDENIDGIGRTIDAERSRTESKFSVWIDLQSLCSDVGR